MLYLNISSVGPRFTWRGNRGGDEGLVRLDLFLASNEWLELFPMSKALNLKPSKSDHLPILIEVREKRPKKKNKKKKKKRLCFHELWLRDEDCKKIVEVNWSISPDQDLDPFSKICCKINKTREALMVWSKAHLAHFFDTSYSTAPIENRVRLEEKLNALLYQEQDFWKQRAKVFWLTDGDLNTSFFHRQASNRRRKNLIKGLHNENGVWCTEDEDMEKIILQYYEIIHVLTAN